MPAILSGAVKQLRSENPNTVFAAAGDLIGASTFESFIQHDEPTIDALNEAGLEVSAAGNHEFDQGYEDLVGRVQERADWEYIAANVEEPAGRDDLAESWTKEIDGVTVGFVGAVTEDLPSLVSPAGIEGVTVTDIVAADERRGERAQGGRCGPDRAAGARGCSGHGLHDDGRRPDVGLRQHHHRRQRQRRRDRVGSHPPGVQLLVPGRRLDRSSGH